MPTNIYGIQLLDVVLSYPSSSNVIDEDDIRRWVVESNVVTPDHPRAQDLIDMAVQQIKWRENERIKKLTDDTKGEA